MKSFFAFTIITALIFTSCTKEDIGPRLKREAAEKVYGKWILERQVFEVYEPINVLNSTAEYFGTEQDVYVFRVDGYADVYSTGAVKSEVLYEVINPNQVAIGNDVWKIEKLTGNDLWLVKDRNDALQYKRYVTRLYLKR
jgi:hypothetical protein